MKRSFFCVFFALMLHTVVFSQWVRSNGPSGAYTNEIIESGIYLVLNAGNAGIFRSSDNGNSWEWSGWGLPCNEQVVALSDYSGTLYASVNKNGIYRSTDNGASWEPINTGIRDKTFYSAFIDGPHIFAGNSEGGIYYSENNGGTWLNRSIGISDIVFSDFSYFNSKLYAGGYSQNANASRTLFETSDFGITWNPVVVPGIGVNGVLSMIANNGLLYVANDDTVFISADGVTWNSTTVDTNANIVSMGVNGNSVYLTTSNGRYFMSSDNGVTWNLVQNNSTNSFANHVFFSGSKIIMSTDQGLYESIDAGANWQLNNSGISGIQIESFGMNSNYIFTGTDNQGVFRSSDNGQNWELINVGINTLGSLSVGSIINVNEDMYLGTGDGIYKSTNNGNSWDFVFNPGLNISTKALDYDAGVLVTGASGTGIYISQDFGVTWNLVSTNGINVSGNFDSIEIMGNTIITSTNNGEIFVSQDLGVSWSNISIPGGFTTISNLQLANNILYAGTSRGLFASNNLGATWSLFNSEILSINDLEIDEDKIYAASRDGVYVTDQTSGEWYPLCEGLGLQYTNQVYIKNDILLAGTFASSVWRRYKVDGIPPQEEDATIGVEELILCTDSQIVDLKSYVGLPSNAIGQWMPSLSENGFFTPGVDDAGTYKFVYQNDLCGCEAYVKVNISVEGLFAGVDNEVTLCSTSDKIDLFESLGPNADLGGVWSPSLTGGTGIFDPKVDASGVYRYTVFNNGCSNDFSEVTVNITDKFNVGTGGDAVICYSDSPVNLFELLGGSPDVGGEWIPALSGELGVFNPAIDQSGTYSYYFPNVDCSNERAELNITVVSKANPGVSSGKVQVCVNSEGVDLFSTFSQLPDSGGSWSPSLASGTSFFDPKVDLPGKYTYTLENNCGVNITNIEVSTYDTFNIDSYSISIEEKDNNKNTITVNLDNSSLYEFSLDGVNFQKQNVFYNVSGGVYDFIGREINGCRYFEEKLLLVGYSSFFTPNGDGINDIWIIRGAPNQNYDLSIFDRYGNLLKTLKTSQGWDGTFNGRPLPSSDYWFKMVFEDGTTKMGHFALKR